MSTIQSTDELDELITKPTAGVLRAVGESPGRFAVLGAGGKMGFHVSRMLSRALESLGRTDQVITVSRFGSQRKRAEFEAAGFEVLAADMSNPDQVDKLPLAENVFYLAGIKFGTSGNAALLEQMNLTMPRLVAERYRQSRIVALSTGCVYDYVTPESGGSSEKSSTNPPGEYAQSCLGREHAFSEASERNGTRVSLIRLNYSVELRYGVLVDIAQKVLQDEEVSLDTGYANVIWQGDAVAHVIQSLSHVSAPPFILNVTGPGILKVRDVATMFGERFGRTPRFVGQPKETAWLNDASLSHQLFGLPAVTVTQMIDWIADWLQQGKETLNKPTQFEVRDGKY
ncbi:MAG: NAD(P)-dependent oxidoreductase [Planctomycetales bacterium]|nr:NAD(P)-dependent oxidoreductase [Planctomycetales bacterium]